MHIESALISTGVAVSAYAVTAGANAFSFIKNQKAESGFLPREKADGKTAKNPAFVGCAAALVFALQMLNIPIVGTGSSGHFVGAVLLAYLLGPYAATLSMSAVLTVQCLLFADGGLVALGVNIVNMAVLPCLVVYPLVLKAVSKIFKRDAAAQATALAVSAYVSIILGAFMVAVETLPNAQIPFAAFAAQMLSIHALIGLIEASITIGAAALFWFVAKIAPNGRKNLALCLFTGALALLCGGVLSLFANALPDGLEWSVASVSDTIATAPVDRYFAAHTLFPDYAAFGAAWGTAISGLAGCFAVFALALPFFSKRAERIA